MKKVYRLIVLVTAVLMTGLTFTSCDDDLSTDQFNSSGVTLLAFGPSPILRNEEIKIVGTNLNKVSQVIFVSDLAVTSFNSQDKETICVTVPDEALPGQIKLVAGSDTVTSITPLTFEEPIEVTSVTPTENLNAGDIITITGEYVYNIASITFATDVVVEAADFVSASRYQVQVAVPLAAESGTIVFSNGDDWELEWETPLDIISASYKGLSVTEGDFGETITITGTNLQTIESIMFSGGVTAEFTLVDNETITVVVPDDCKSGSITLLTYSGNALSTDEFTVPTIAIDTVSPAEDLVEGDVITVTGENFDRISEIYLPGIADALSADYYTIVDSNTLTITVPAGMNDGDIQLVQNANITATYTLSVRKLEGVIWQGSETLTGWGSWGVWYWSGTLWDTFCEAITGAGQLTIHYTIDYSGAQFSCKQGDWSTSFTSTNLTETGGIFYPADDETDLVIDLTDAEAYSMFGYDTANGLVVWGDGITVQYVKFVASGSEYTIWEGSFDCGSWSSFEYIGTDASEGDVEIVQSGYATAGSVVRFYGTASSDDWQLQINEGHWGGEYITFTADNVTDFGTTGCCPLTLTDDMITAATTGQWWGGTFVVQGQDFVLTKVTIAPY